MLHVTTRHLFFVYPVKDLQRAMKFYNPILGNPEYSTPSHASYNFEGARFRLDSNPLDGYAEIKNNLPNGYVIIYVEDLESEMQRLQRKKVSILSEIKNDGKDTYVICKDPSENIFLLKQRELEKDKKEILKSKISIKDQGSHQAAELLITQLMTAWMHMDGDKIFAQMTESVRWYDDTGSKRYGITHGKEDISKLIKDTWNQYDQTSAGLDANMKIVNIHVNDLLNKKMINFKYILKGSGAHPFTETALVTLIYIKVNDQWKLDFCFISSSNQTFSYAKELDYTGYPVLQLKKAEKFYTDIMKLGDPYKDSQYRGYWTDHSVFGIYTAKQKRDKGLPRPEKCNGYVSFWIHSAKDVFEYLEKQGSSFPKIPAINTRVKIDRQPGYTQVLGTDSEGNAVLFTEYPGD